MEVTLAPRAFSAIDFPIFPENAKDIRKLESLLREDFPGDELLGIPAKITVSEIQEIAAKEAGVSSSKEAAILSGMREMALQLRLSERPTVAGGKALSASAYGSFLHSIFQKLNPADFLEATNDEASSAKTDYQLREKAETIYAEKIEELLQIESIAKEDKDLALEAWVYVEKFLRSDLAARLTAAERKSAFVARELPFTLSLPLTELAEASATFANEQESTVPKIYPGEFRLVQGMIDLFFDEGEDCVLVDYKSDYLGKNPAENLKILEERYNEQIDIYTQAIERLRGKRVKERYIWAVREGKAYAL